MNRVQMLRTSLLVGSAFVSAAEVITVHAAKEATASGNKVRVSEVMQTPSSKWLGIQVNI